MWLLYKCNSADWAKGIRCALCVKCSPSMAGWFEQIRAANLGGPFRFHSLCGA